MISEDSCTHPVPRNRVDVHSEIPYLCPDITLLSSHFISHNVCKRADYVCITRKTANAHGLLPTPPFLGVPQGAGNYVQKKPSLTAMVKFQTGLWVNFF